MKRYLHLILLILIAFGSTLAIACSDLDDASTCDPSLEEECVCADDSGQTCDPENPNEDEDGETLSCLCTFPDEQNPNVTNGNAGDQSILIENFSFSQAALTITAGSTVTWNNNSGGEQHALVCTDASGANIFDQTLNTGESFSFTFANAGTYTVTDRINDAPGLTMTITVN